MSSVLVLCFAWYFVYQQYHWALTWGWPASAALFYGVVAGVVLTMIFGAAWANVSEQF